MIVTASPSLLDFLRRLSREGRATTADDAVMIAATGRTRPGIKTAADESRLPFNLIRAAIGAYLPTAKATAAADELALLNLLTDRAASPRMKSGMIPPLPFRAFQPMKGALPQLAVEADTLAAWAADIHGKLAAGARIDRDLWKTSKDLALSPGTDKTEAWTCAVLWAKLGLLPAKDVKDVLIEEDGKARRGAHGPEMTVKKIVPATFYKAETFWELWKNTCSDANGVTAARDFFKKKAKHPVADFKEYMRKAGFEGHRYDRVRRLAGVVVGRKRKFGGAWQCELGDTSLTARSKVSGEEAQRLLAELLKDGPVHFTAGNAWRRQQRWKLWTLKNAKKALGVRTLPSTSGGAPEWWCLPEQTPPAAPRTPIAQFMAAPDLVRALNLPSATLSAVKAFLDRFSRRNPDCTVEADSGRKNEPSRLYRVADVWPALWAHFYDRKRATDEPRK
jgi:hypothetical protein